MPSAIFLPFKLFNRRNCITIKKFDFPHTLVDQKFSSTFFMSKEYYLPSLTVLIVFVSLLLALLSSLDFLNTTILNDLPLLSSTIKISYG